MAVALYLEQEAIGREKMGRREIIKAYKGKPRQAEDMTGRQIVVRLRDRVELVLTGLRPAKSIGLGGGEPLRCYNE
jgi:hypothetical protein